MASREPIDLVFGDETFKIRPLTFKQVQDLSEKLAQPGVGNVDQMKLARDAISIALSRDHSAIKIDDLECDVSLLAGQLLQIMQLGGFRPREDQPVGEAEAAAGRDGGASEAA